jgi:hypothetical protein
VVGTTGGCNGMANGLHRLILILLVQPFAVIPLPTLVPSYAPWGRDMGDAETATLWAARRYVLRQSRSRMRRIRTSGLMSGEGRRIAKAYLRGAVIPVR